MDSITLTELRKPHPCDDCAHWQRCHDEVLACPAYAYHITQKAEYMPSKALPRYPCMTREEAERERIQGELIL